MVVGFLSEKSLPGLHCLGFFLGDFLVLQSYQVQSSSSKAGDGGEFFCRILFAKTMTIAHHPINQLYVYFMYLYDCIYRRLSPFPATVSNEGVGVLLKM